VSARGTALLVTLLAALVAYLWAVELPILRPTPPRHGLPDAAPLLSVPAATVARLDIERDGRQLTAVRRDGGWADPEGRPWRSGAVSDLLETLSDLRPVMVVDPHPQAPADYGLDHAAQRLRLTAVDGRTVLALELGDRNPAWTDLYARLAGRPEVVLLGGVLRWELGKVFDTAPGPEP